MTGHDAATVQALAAAVTWLEGGSSDPQQLIELCRLHVVAGAALDDEQLASTVLRALDSVRPALVQLIPEQVALEVADCAGGSAGVADRKKVAPALPTLLPPFSQARADIGGEGSADRGTRNRPETPDIGVLETPLPLGATSPGQPAGLRVGLIIEPATGHDGAPIAWFGPVLAHLAALGLDDTDLELWLSSPCGVEEVPTWTLCDARTADAGDYCDAPSVACIGDAWSPVCADHLPGSTAAPCVGSIGWRLVEWVDDSSAYIDRFAATAVSAHAFCEANRGHDVADLLSAGLRQAAKAVGGTDELVSHRPGSWEASHVAGLAALFDL